jgi:ferredoxin/flavodoxin
MKIFYFSGTGNTKYVSEYLSDALNKKGMANQTVDIACLSDNEISTLVKNSESLFLAYPIYGSDMPENMKRFIEIMPQAQGKKLGVVCTQMAFSGDGASIEFKKLKNKGYKQMWGFQVNMPNNLCIQGSPLKQCDDYAIIEKKYLKKARAKLDAYADLIIADKRKVTDNSFLNHFIALSQRPLYRKYVLKNEISKLGIDEDKCNQCGLCADLCPNGVIEKGEKVAFGDRTKCTLCIRCMNFCPSQAVVYRGKIKLPQYKGPTKDVYHRMISKKE